MKTLKMFVLITLLAISGVASAATNPERPSNDDKNVVIETIGKLLENPTVDLNYEAKATVMLTVNKENQLVVLSIDAENRQVASFIKSRLNYKKLDGDYDNKLKAFNVPVRILGN
jgi:hypothetical protein